MVDAAEAERLELTGDVAALDALLGGRRLVDNPVELLGVDPVDDEAVRQRLGQLREELRRFRAQQEQQLAEAARADAGVAAGTAGAELEGPAIAAGDGSSAPDPEPTLSALRITRLERMVQFLDQPLHERALAVAADDATRALAQELTAAAAETEEAAAGEAEAEAAAAAAVADAEAAAAAAARELGEERARALSVLFEHAKLRRQNARLRERLARHGRRWGQLAEDVHVVTEHGAPTEGVADELYDRIVVALDESRGSFDRALRALDAPSEFPSFELRVDVGAPRYRTHPVEREELLRAVRDVGEVRDESVIRERRSRWTHAKSLATHVRDLDRARQRLLPFATEAKRQRLLSLGPEGVAQLGREAYHLSLMARWYLRTRPAELAHLPAWLGGVIAESSSRWTLLQLLLVVFLGMLLVARRTQLTARFRDLLVDAAETPDALAIAEKWTRALSAVLIPVTLLTATYLIFGLAARLAQPPELEFIRALFVAGAWYGLSVSLMHYGIVGVTRARRRDLPPALSRRIMRSLRIVSGYVLFAVVLLIIDQQLLGRGYIQKLVGDFAWIGFVPILVIILRKWRVEITAAYRKRYPGSSLSRVLERVRDKPWDIVALFPATLRLAVAGAGGLVEHTALRFDRIRRALAYLFRRRLEKSAETIGRGTVDVTALPIALRRAFDPAELLEEFKVDRFPALADVLEEVTEWKRGGSGKSVALVGPVGIGKSTWLGELRRQAGDIEVVEHVLEDSHEDERAVCHTLSRAFGLAQEHEDVNSLVDALSELPPRLVLLDHCQNLHLRCVGGLAGITAYATIVRRTAQRFFWVSAFSLYAYEHMRYVSGGTGSLFTRIEHLKGWSEEELAALIDQRLTRAEMKARYDDLLPAGVTAVEREAELERTRERYLRLLWDYTDGLPRVALYYFLRSLVIDGDDSVRVRLFDAPRADDLEHLDSNSRFLLHAIVSHENLSIAEAARVLAMSADELASIFEMLRLQGYLSRHGDRYRVTTRWDRAVVSYLRRKHLLYT